MNTHAVLMSAYNDFDILLNNVKILAPCFDCYIHVDRKAEFPPEIRRKLQEYPNVYVIQKYRITWGSYKHILAFLELLKMAEPKGYEWHHLITGNSVLVRPYKELEAFFMDHDGQIFMNYVDVKASESRKDLEYWFQYYRYPYLYNQRGKHRRLWENFEWYYIKIQKKLGIKRKVYFDYKGYLYCQLPDAATKYVLQYVKENPRYIHELKYCHVGEEFFFQNILMHSTFRDKVINQNLIYDDWSPERERPAFLNEGDYDRIMESGCFFARKINASSKGLMEKIHI